MNISIEPSWRAALKEEFGKEYFAKLTEFVKQEYLSTTVYPPVEFIFNAFELCPFEKVEVVIIGQDPYHGPGQAHGLSFSVPEGQRIPPSLRNIYKEIRNDLGQAAGNGDLEVRQSGNLESWAKQGVLLLNATLTVRAETPGSHQNQGWEAFTDAVIRTISDKKERVVFILWGRYAREKAALIDGEKHLILESAHPSPFSATKFYGNHHFSKTNEYLEKHGKPPIKWI